jgi:hypothetical protein
VQHILGRARNQVNEEGEEGQLVGQVPIKAASSTGRCNTIRCVDSTLLPQENHLYGCPPSKPRQLL